MKNCQFGALAEEMILDQVVEKTVHPRLHERFLQNNALTLENVLNQAKAYECSTRLSREMGDPVHHGSNYQHGHTVLGSA